MGKLASIRYWACPSMETQSSSQYRRKHPNLRSEGSGLATMTLLGEFSDGVVAPSGAILWPWSSSWSFISLACRLKPLSIWLREYRRPFMQARNRMSEYKRALAVLIASSETSRSVMSSHKADSAAKADTSIAAKTDAVLMGSS
jgi:hypothetical protein